MEGSFHIEWLLPNSCQHGSRSWHCNRQSIWSLYYARIHLERVCVACPARACPRPTRDIALSPNAHPAAGGQHVCCGNQSTRTLLTQMWQLVLEDNNSFQKQSPRRWSLDSILNPLFNRGCTTATHASGEHLSTYPLIVRLSMQQMVSSNALINNDLASKARCSLPIALPWSLLNQPSNQTSSSVPDSHVPYKRKMRCALKCKHVRQFLNGGSVLLLKAPSYQGYCGQQCLRVACTQTVCL